MSRFEAIMLGFLFFLLMVSSLLPKDATEAQYLSLVERIEILEQKCR